MAAGSDSLGQRLQRLTGVSPDECIAGYESEARRIERDPAFRKELRRLRALADPRRLLVVRLLEDRGELCACEIQAALGASHPLVSHHMAVLAKAGIVESERRGKWVHYRLLPDVPHGLP